MKKNKLLLSILFIPNMVFGIEKPFGWNDKLEWWDLQNGEEIFAMTIIFSFLGIFYCLWHGFGQVCFKTKLLYFMSSLMFFILILVIVYSDYLAVGS